MAPHAAMGVAVAACLLGACSKPSVAGGATVASAPVADTCALKFISQADMAPILGEAVTSVRPQAGDSQSCVFETATFTSVTVSLRPGLGRATVAAWVAGKMPLSARPLPGVGERAVWQPTLHEVIAEQNDLLCDIGVAGAPDATAGATPQRLGALCRRIFSAERPSI